MPARILAAIFPMLFLIGCTASAPIPTVTSLPRPAAASGPGTGSLFAIREVGLGVDGYVGLTNFTGQPASLAGLTLCQGVDCFELPAIEVAPGSTARVAVGEGKGLENVVAEAAALGELRPSDGEIALFSGSPPVLLAYLEWGSTPHAHTQTAIDRGLWIEGSYAPSSASATRLQASEGGLWRFTTE